MNVHTNQTVRGRSSELLEGDCASLKPDLWWWDGNHLFIAEFTIPYGMLSNVNDEQVSTLTIRRKEKLEKYNNLVKECKRQLQCDATLLIYIVSSLGALPSETLDDLKRVTRSIKEAGKLAGRMVAASLRESMMLYYSIKCKKQNEDPNSNNDDNAYNDNNSDNESNAHDPIDATTESDNENDHSMNIVDNKEWEELIHDVTTNSYGNGNAMNSKTSNLEDDADTENRCS